MRAAEYPFGRAAGSFFLGGGETLEPDPSRPPLLAYGANASPAVLEGKLGPGARAAALAARLHDWAIVHSAHVSPYGAVPATLIQQPGAVADVFVLLVEDLAVLDATEPNYDRVTLTGIDLDADRLGRLGAAEAYISKWGPLLRAGAPVPLGALPQDELLTAVRGAA